MFCTFAYCAGFAAKKVAMTDEKKPGSNFLPGFPRSDIAGC